MWRSLFFAFSSRENVEDAEAATEGVQKKKLFLKIWHYWQENNCAEEQLY